MDAEYLRYRLVVGTHRAVDPVTGERKNYSATGGPDGKGDVILLTEDQANSSVFVGRLEGPLDDSDGGEVIEQKQVIDNTVNEIVTRSEETNTDEPSDDDNDGNDDSSTDWSFISPMTIPRVLKVIEGLDDANEVESLYNYEEANKNRPRVLDAARTKYGKLTTK